MTLHLTRRAVWLAMVSLALAACSRTDPEQQLLETAQALRAAIEAYLQMGAPAPEADAAAADLPVALDVDWSDDGPSVPDD